MSVNYFAKFSNFSSDSLSSVKRSCSRKYPKGKKITCAMETSDVAINGTLL